MHYKGSKIGKNHTYSKKLFRMNPRIQERQELYPGLIYSGVYAGHFIYNVGNSRVLLHIAGFLPKFASYYGGGSLSKFCLALILGHVEVSKKCVWFGGGVGWVYIPKSIITLHSVEFS